VTFPLLLRLTAFSDTREGGNPAGVWIGDALPEAAEMQRIAAEVGFSETAFLVPSSGRDRVVKYYSPAAEVSFCGHATIASGVALGGIDGTGVYRFSTASGEVSVEVSEEGGRYVAALTSVEPRHTAAPDELVDAALSLLGWRQDELDPAIPPARVFAGAWHLALAAARRERLDRLEYDFEALKALMLADGLTTLQLFHRASPERFHSRNPFPVGGVFEDPATGASAAALGGYLRAIGQISPPATLVIDQGVAMGRPSRLTVFIPPKGGIVVSGTAIAL